MFTEISHKKINISPLFEVARRGKFRNIQSRIEVTRGGGKVELEVVAKWVQSFCWDDEKVLEIVVMVTQY